MNQKDTFRSALPMAALDEIPEPSANAKEIVGLVKSSGKITGYQLSDGQTVSKSEGVAMAKAGDIQGVGVAHRGDTEYLKALPDGNETNNLSSLPTTSASSNSPN
nr:DUF3892 domain-containing protein [Eubacterium sp.]